MATGKRTQPGETASARFAAGKAGSRGGAVPGPGSRRSLAKRPRRESRSSSGRRTRMLSRSPSPSAGWRRALPWALFGVTALGFAAFALVARDGQGEARFTSEPVRLQIALPKKPPLQLTGALALSPDGRQLAFGASGADGIPRVYLRAMDSLEMRPLPGTESVGSLLFWKPDGRFIAFDSGGKLRKIDVSGGPAETVCSLNLTGVGGSWNTRRRYPLWAVRGADHAGLRGGRRCDARYGSR